MVTKNKEYTYFSYKNEGVIITNIDRVGESHCAGGLNISRGRMNGDVLCENISGEYYFYTKYSNFNMDPTNNILKFEIVDGTGPFLELLDRNVLLHIFLFNQTNIYLKENVILLMLTFSE